MVIAARILHRLALNFTLRLAFSFYVDTSTAPVAPANASTKVAKCIIRVLAIDLDGGCHDVISLSYQTLLCVLAHHAAGQVVPCAERSPSQGP